MVVETMGLPAEDVTLILAVDRLGPTKFWKLLRIHALKSADSEKGSCQILECYLYHHLLTGNEKETF